METLGNQYEATLLTKALKAFNQRTGLRAVVEKALGGDKRDQGVDAVVCLKAKGLKVRFIAELKKRLTTETLGAAVRNLARHENGLLITDYVNPRMAERLRHLRIAFMDTVGNAFIEKPPIFVFIKGEGPPTPQARARPTRAFQPTGLKVVFVLLCNKELVNAPYRDIARAADVALGTVGWVIRDLKGLGFLVGGAKGVRQLAQKEGLLERWVMAYPDQLRPKLLIGRFAATDPDWWEHAHIRDFEAYWGGEVAATRLTEYLKPERVTVYVRKALGRIAHAHKLTEDPRGKTEILRAFWDARCDWMDKETVHPYLVYADLLATGDPRNIETARILYDNEVTRLIRKD